jgi:DNA repair exonuclease SbcCD ATPase subunit
MNGFKRSLFGYRRLDVDNAISDRDARILGLELSADAQRQTLAELEAETTALSGMVIDREREIRVLDQRLREANECHDRSIASLEAITARLEEVEAQARGQATRIRMKALREAVEVSKKVKALTEVEPALGDESNGNGSAPAADGLYEGEVKLEIGPLDDFSQLVGFEDAVGQIGASEISVERFSEGRATFSMQLDEPVDLLHELEELSALDFKVRRAAPDNLVLDIDEDQGPEQRAA